MAGILLPLHKMPVSFVGMHSLQSVFFCHNRFLKLHVFLQNCYEEARLFGCFKINLPCLQLNRERMLSGFSRSSDGCDLTKLMNAHQTRQIPDCLCLDQPSVHIPPGTAHVSRGFST